MTKSGVINALHVLLLPHGPIDWVARLTIWCSITSVLFLSVKSVLGLDVELRIDLAVMFLTSAPLFLCAMIFARHWDKSQKDLAKIADTDALTGLMNRRALFQAIEASDEGALLIIDIDHFKLVNDRYGHAVGDAVLVAIADHLQRNLRSGDLLGRIGGEEFGVYLFGADSMQVDLLGERICKGFVLYNDDVPSPIKITMSIGTAYSAMSPDITELYRRADGALYQAKHSGRARLNFWQPPNASRA